MLIVVGPGVAQLCQVHALHRRQQFLLLVVPLLGNGRRHRGRMGLLAPPLTPTAAVMIPFLASTASLQVKMVPISLSCQL